MNINCSLLCRRCPRAFEFDCMWGIHRSIALKQGQPDPLPSVYGCCWSCSTQSHCQSLHCRLSWLNPSPRTPSHTLYFPFTAPAERNLRPVPIWMTVLSALEEPVLMRTCRNWIIDACMFLSLIISQTDSLPFAFGTEPGGCGSEVMQPDSLQEGLECKVHPVVSSP